MLLDHISPCSLKGSLSHLNFQIFYIGFFSLPKGKAKWWFIALRVFNCCLRHHPLKLDQCQCVSARPWNPVTALQGSNLKVPRYRFWISVWGVCSLSCEWYITKNVFKNLAVVSPCLIKQKMAKRINNASSIPSPASHSCWDLLSEGVHVYSADEWESNYLIWHQSADFTEAWPSVSLFLGTHGRPSAGGAALRYDSLVKFRQ